MTRALVTGSTGGLGANIVAALNARGVEVVGLRRDTSPSVAVEGLALTPITGDILDPDSLGPAVEGVDWVFHAAAIADDWHYPAETIYRVNVEGTRNVLRAAREAGVARFIYTSSVAALGAPGPDRPTLDETATFNLDPGVWPYGHSKALAEEVIREEAGGRMQTVALLPSAIMGPCDWKFISGELIVRALKRQIFPFPEGGLNFVDMRDCAAAHVAAAECADPAPRYVIGGHNLTHREALTTIGEVLGVPVRILRVPEWALPSIAAGVTLLHRLGVDLPVERARVLLSGHHVYVDSSKASRELGLRARPFAESVRDAYHWYREHGYLERRGVPAHRLAEADSASAEPDYESEAHFYG
jgi:dihydroflavonol-4-reductase